MSTPGPPIAVFIVIANVDDELTPGRWAKFHSEVAELLRLAGAKFLGEWYCSPISLWQNACWCVDIQPGIAERLQEELAKIGVQYGRGAVAWNEVPEPLCLG